MSKKWKSSSETDCCSEFLDGRSVFVMFSSLWCLQQLGWLDSYVGLAWSSNFFVFSFLAYSDEWNGYELTDKYACCSVAFYNFLLLFVKGRKISMNVFLLFYCDVCDRRNDFWLNLFLWIIFFCVPIFKEGAKNGKAHQNWLLFRVFGWSLSFRYVFFSLMFATIRMTWFLCWPCAIVKFLCLQFPCL